MKRCPAAAIEVDRPGKTVLFEPFRCIICEACAEICPKDVITVEAQHRSPAYQKHTEVRGVPAETKA
jgi:Fe-S-cluster-containing hydrogenase component 2